MVKATPKRDPESQYWDEDADRINRMCALAHKLKYVVGKRPKVIPLNPDGSAKTVKESRPQNYAEEGTGDYVGGAQDVHGHPIDMGARFAPLEVSNNADTNAQDTAKQPRIPRMPKSYIPVGHHESQTPPEPGTSRHLSHHHRLFMASSPASGIRPLEHLEEHDDDDDDLGGVPLPTKGRNESYRITFPSNTGRVIWKPASGEDPSLRSTIVGGTGHRREVAASVVADILGMDDLVPKTTFRTQQGKHGSAQHWVENAGAALGEVESRRYGTNPDDVGRAAILDYLIGNTDRHQKNWLVGADGKMHLIDHGLSFPDHYLRENYANSAIMAKAAERGLPITDEMKKKILDSWPEIEESLRHTGIDEQAIDLARKRMKNLVNPHLKRFDHLPLPWLSSP